MGKSGHRCVFFHAAGSYQEVVWRPAVDVYRIPGGWIAKFDLAGVRLEDIELEVGDRSLFLRGLRRDWLIQEGCAYHSLEIAYSRFERHIEFPADLTHATISTDYQAGMLMVRINSEGTNR
jgi:HSP20 family molecular chaperone IbpA